MTSDPEIKIPPDPHGPPKNWREALTTLLAARFDLLEYEAKLVGKSALRCMVFAVIGGLAFAFFWALLLIALIGWITATSGSAWYWIAAIAAGVHLLAGIIFLVILKSSNKPSFALTRGEFRKDREWINSLHKSRKSSN